MGKVLAATRISRIAEGSGWTDIQSEAIESWAKINGHQIIEWAPDPGVSGGVDPRKRKGLGPWFGRLDEWDILAVHKIDRLSRSIADLAALVQWAEANGKGIVATGDGIDTTTSGGRLQAHLMGVLADFELDRIKNRCRDSQRHHRQLGLWHGGSAIPYGYIVVGTKGSYRLMVDPETADFARDLIRRAIEGASINSLAKERSLDTTAMTKWLRGHFLYGAKVHRGQVVIGADGKPVSCVQGSPLIDRTTYDRLQIALKARAGTRAPSVQANTRNPLRGLLHCSCGASMNPSSSNGHPDFRCRTRTSYWRNRHPGQSHCGQTPIVRASLVLRSVDMLMLGIDTAPEVERVWVERDGDELALVEKTIARLREDRDLEVITSDDYKAMMAPLVETRKTLKGNSRLASGWVEQPTGRTISAAYRGSTTSEEKRSVLLAGGWSFVVKSTEAKRGRVLTIHAMKNGKQYGWTGL